MDRMTVRDIDVKDKRVLVRVDFNVPLGNDGHITVDGRIRAAIPTIEYLVEQGAKVIIMSHMGRPDGKVVQSMSLKVAADRLSELMRHPVQFAKDHAEFRRAFDSFSGDADLLYPHWRHELK